MLLLANSGQGVLADLSGGPQRLTGHFTLRRACGRGLPPQMVPLQFCSGKAADMPPPGCAALRHVVNSQTLSEMRITHAG